MNTRQELCKLLDQALGLDGRAQSFDTDTPLMGALPELDSMGVVAILTALEDRLGIAVDDDEIDASVFETFGSLWSFVENKLAS